MHLIWRDVTASKWINKLNKLASPSLSWKLCYYTCPFLRQHVSVIRDRNTRRFDFVELISGSCSSASRFFKSKELDCRRSFLVSFPVPSRRANPQVTPATQARMKIVMINDRRNKLKVKLLFKKTYYMAQVTSCKIARCDWLLAWQNRGHDENCSNKIMFKTFLAL